MPYQILLPLKTLEPHPNAPQPRPWHAMVYAWLHAGDAELARRVHDEMEPKPFSLAPLKPNGAHAATLAIGLLDDALWEPLRAGLHLEKDFAVQGKWYALAGEPTVTHCAYEALWSAARADTSIVLQFLSPTSFHTHGVHYPLPDPALTFQSYFLRWNRLAPAALQININLLDAVAAHVVVAQLQVETQAVEFGGYRQVGFVGRVRFHIKQSEWIGKEVVRQLNALADFANYAGTGHKTTQGMGQTRRLERQSR